MFRKGQPNPADSSRNQSLRVAPAAGEVVNRPCCGGRDCGDMRDDEAPDDADLARFSGVTRTCPHCSKEVHDDAELCYHCGLAIDAPRQRDAERGLPRWAAVTASVLLAAILFGVLGGFPWLIGLIRGM
jgi:hypothetical protein